MSTQLRTILTVALFAGPILSACLSSQTLATLGLTATASVQTTNINVCKNIYSQFGYCVNQDELITKINERFYKTARGTLRNGDGAANVLDQIQKRLDKMITNAKTLNSNATLMNVSISANVTGNATAKARLLQTVTAGGTANGTANTTTPLANGTATGAASGTTTVKLPGPPAAPAGKSGKDKAVTVKDSSQAAKTSAKNMSIKADTIAKLEALKTTLDNNAATLKKFGDKEARKACYKSINKLTIGSLCLATSGAATTYVTLNGNNIASIQIAQTDAAAVTTDCMPMVYQMCAIAAAREAFKAIGNNGNAGTTTTTTNNGVKSDTAQVCDALAANPSCVQNPSSCSADIQTLILKNMIRPGDNPIKTDIDLQGVSDNVATVDASMSATISSGNQTPARRLQTTSSSGEDYGYQTTSGAPSSMNEADKSNIPSDSVEDNISSEVPASANSSGSVIITRLSLGLVLTLILSVLV